MKTDQLHKSQENQDINY